MENRKKVHDLNDLYKCKRCKKNVYVKYTTCPRCGFCTKDITDDLNLFKNYLRINEDEKR